MPRSLLPALAAFALAACAASAPQGDWNPPTALSRTTPQRPEASAEPDGGAPATSPADERHSRTAEAADDGTIEFRCPGGETPTAIRTGCMCGGAIHNPCKSGGLFPAVEGDTCVFQCPTETAEWTPQTDEEKCLKKCNDESGWRHMGQCQAACEHAAASDAACDDSGIMDGKCRALCKKGDRGACGRACSSNLDPESCLVLCREGDAKACVGACVSSYAACDALCQQGNAAACDGADPAKRERLEQAAVKKAQARAGARLPALFTKCEANRAVVYKWKKQWIDARRVGDDQKAARAEQKLSEFQPKWAATLAEIREAIRAATGDEGPKFRKHVLDVKKRCSLPAWAGFID